MHVPLLKSKQASLTIRNLGVKSYNHFIDLLDLDCSELCYKIQLKNYFLQLGVPEFLG